MTRASTSADDLRVEPLCELIRERFGFGVKDAWFDQLRQSVSRRMEERGLAFFPDYWRVLREEGGASELQALVDEILIHETCFLRTPAHFDSLRQQVFPELLRQRPRGKLRFVSLGCSSGEEPLSLAIAASEFFSPQDLARIEITGVDVSQKILRTARKATYSTFQLRELDEARRSRWFTRDGDAWQARPELRNIVRFLYGNLVDSLPFTAVDVIFCRNVLIYFQKPVVAKLIESFHATLNPGGFLFLGHAESASDFGRLFRPIYTEDTFYFQRRSASENDRELDRHKALSDAFEEVRKCYEATTP